MTFFAVESQNYLNVLIKGQEKKKSGSILHAYKNRIYSINIEQGPNFRSTSSSKEMATQHNSAI